MGVLGVSMNQVSRRSLVGAVSTLPLLPTVAAAQINGQMALTHNVRFTPDGVFYDTLESDKVSNKPTVVMIHGAGHTGFCFWETPDGRPGWAPYFARHGYRVIVPDWPGTGRSGYVPYDKLTGELVCERLGALISSQSSPVIMMTHSMSGPYGWKLLEKCGKNIATVLAIAPGPPRNIQKPVQILSETPEKVEVLMTVKITISLKDPVVANQDLIEKKLIGLNSTRFPRAAKSNYETTLVGIPPHLIYERVNVGNSQLQIEDFTNYSSKRVAVVIGTDDPDHPIEMDKPIVDWLNQNGSKAELIALGERGIKGNGHMMMIESNSDEIAELLIEWLERT
jgi:pimeloyl-ACP methyl ester carboxylesterase